MTKILLVYGESDYGALLFEESGKSPEEIFDKVQTVGGSARMEIVDEFSEDTLYLHAKEFGEVDPKFIEFIRDEIQDYDHSKSKNFYVI